MRTMKILEERAAQALRELTNQLIDTHGLKGRAVEQVLKRLAADWRIDEPLSEGRFAVVGGILSGALSGLATDIISGGLTLGTGTLAGAALGALGAAGVAKGYNVYKGKDGTTVSWNAGALDRILKESLLLYLAVAHYGRGRGEWSRSEHPAHWGSTIESAVESQSLALEEIWTSRGELAKAGSLEEKLANVIDKMLRFSLNQLYPEAKVFPVEDRIHHDNVRDFQMG